MLYRLFLGLGSSLVMLGIVGCGGGPSTAPPTDDQVRAAQEAAGEMPTAVDSGMIAP